MNIARRVDNPPIAAHHELAAYRELIDILDNLPLIVREARRRKGQSLRAAQADSGVDQATILSAERGGNLTVTNVRALLEWASR